MPTYFFEFENGDTETETYSFQDDGAAIQEARLRAFDGTAHQLDGHKRATGIRVRNERGDEIHFVRMKRS